MEPQLSKNRISPLMDMLTRIRCGDFTAEDRKEATELLQRFNAFDLKKVQKHLAKTGYSPTIAQQLCRVFAQIAASDQTKRKLDHLPLNHILRRIRAEHDLYRCYLADLTESVEQMGSVSELTDMTAEFRHVVHLVSNLSGLKEHFECEQDAIFPYLKKVGWSALCETAERQHRGIEENLNQIISLTLLTEQITMQGYRTTITSLTRQLTPRLLNHLDYEDEVLWPAAGIIINDSNIWETIKALCDMVGYNGMRPHLIL